MKKILIIILLLLIFILFGCYEREKTKKAPPKLKNQKKAEKNIVFKNGEKLVSLKEVVNATDVEIDGDKLFVLDEVVVYVYSLKDYQLLRQFGRIGNGPGEFCYYPISPVMMDLYDDKVLLSRFNKVAIYTKSGKLLKENVFQQKFSEFTPISENYAMVAVQFFVPENSNVSKVLLKLCDPSFKIVKTLYEKTYQAEDENFVEKIA